MTIWDYSEDKLIASGAIHTAAEIYRQPLVWREIYRSIVACKGQIKEFMNRVLSEENFQIILTGAGSSAFIGLSLKGSFLRNYGKHTSCVPTTDLVTHPDDFFNSHVPVLLVSFARSGNSPESVAAITIADNICPKVFHLIITCDASGKLANVETSSLKYVFLLPPEANDQSLAMTSSYSGMLLAGLLMTRIDEIDRLTGQMELVNDYALKLLNHYYGDFRQMAAMDFHRAVFLGSGPQFGTATESHLKLQELTDGSIICKNDSFLGFRHGPKAVIDNHTVVFYLFSNQPYVFQYERDLADSIHKSGKALYEAGILEIKDPEVNLNKEIILSDNGSLLYEDFLPVCNIIPAQMLGFFKSIKLGLSPDSPSVSGAISRVVQGVKIYPYNNHKT
jgi:tagatose-6-phosphate ketose/aldose isomerase